MLSNPTIYNILKISPILAFTVLLYRLYSGRLHKIYPFFALYAVVELVRQVVAAMIPHRSNAYAYFYIGAEIVVWMLCVMAILELYGLVLRNHPGIVSFGRIAL